MRPPRRLHPGLALALSGLITLAGCATPWVDGRFLSGLYFGEGIEQASARQQIDQTRDRRELFEALVFGLVSDRNDLIAAALSRGADPNRQIPRELARMAYSMPELAEIARGLPGHDRLPPEHMRKPWMDLWLKNTLDTLGAWCEAGRVARRDCDPENTRPVESSRYPVFVLVRSPEAVDLLIAHGAKVDQRLLDAAMVSAARDGNVVLAERLTALGARPDTVAADGTTPLHLAAARGQAEMVAWLLRRGVDPNTGVAPVAAAPVQGGGSRQRGPGVGQIGVTPLHFATTAFTDNSRLRDWRGLRPIIGRVVPGAAADVAGLQPGDRVVAVEGKPIDTADEFAAAIRSSEGWQIFFQIERNGALLDRTLLPLRTVDGSYRGWLQFELAQLDRLRPVPDLASRLRTVQHLIAAGADVNARAVRNRQRWWLPQGAFDYTPLHAAYDAGFFEVASALERAGADPSLRLASGETPPETVGLTLWERTTVHWQTVETTAQRNLAQALPRLAQQERERAAARQAQQAQQRPAVPVSAPVLASAAVRAATREAADVAAHACDNTIIIGGAQHSFLQLSIPSATRVRAEGTLAPVRGGGQAIRLEAAQGAGNASRVVAQILLPGQSVRTGNVPIIDDNNIPGLENGAVGTFDAYQGREYANFRTNFDHGQNRNMGVVEIVETGARIRGSFRFKAVEDGYPRRGSQYRADVSGSFCVTP